MDDTPYRWESWIRPMYLRFDQSVWGPATLGTYGLVQLYTGQIYEFRRYAE